MIVKDQRTIGNNEKNEDLKSIQQKSSRISKISLCKLPKKFKVSPCYPICPQDW